MSLFDEQNLTEFVSPDYPGERLIGCYNPLLAQERARKHESSARAERDLRALQSQAYRLLSAGPGLTAGVRSADDWPAANRVAATVRLQCYGGTPRALLARLREEMKRFAREEDEAFRRALHTWARALEEDRSGVGSTLPSFEEPERPEGEEMTTVFQANWMRWEEGVRARATAEGRREGMEQGIREGIEKGIQQGIEQGMEQGIERGLERGLERGCAEEGKRFLTRLAALKFDARTAERSSGLLDGLTATEDLDRVGDWLVECKNGGDLRSRVSALRVPAGSTVCAPPGAEASGNGVPCG